jgi:hypothetical protein
MFKQKDYLRTEIKPINRHSYKMPLGEIIGGMLLIFATIIIAIFIYVATP